MNSPLRLRVAAAIIGLLGLVAAPSAIANHPVFVEGNCVNPPTGNPGPVLVGTCGDFDGDSRIGTAEDGDGDRVFGTIGAALGGGTGANQNGSVTIVTSGVFAETVVLTGANGNVTLQAAPGVEANIDAVLQGDAGSAARQGASGIVVNAPADRRITIRNVMSRNWTTGYDILGSSHVTLIGVRAENNVNWGIRAQDNTRVAIQTGEVQATGFRVGGGQDFPRLDQPVPGVGIEYEDQASGTVCDSTVTGSFGAGIKDSSTRSVIASHDNVFDNNPNLRGHVDFEDDCVAGVRRHNNAPASSAGGTGGLPYALLGLGLAGFGLARVRSRGSVKTG